MACRAVSTVRAPRVWSECRVTGLWAYPAIATRLLAGSARSTVLRSRPNAGTETPAAMSSKARAPAPRPAGARRAVDQPADQAEVGLLDQLDVDQDEGHVVEAGQERLAHDRPGPDRAPAV
jgi:hypothetical protein